MIGNHYFLNAKFLRLSDCNLSDSNLRVSFSTTIYDKEFWGF